MPVVEAEQVVESLKKRNIPVDYVLFPDEGHGFARPINNLAMFMQSEKFLAQHLGGRCMSHTVVHAPEIVKPVIIGRKR